MDIKTIRKINGTYNQTPRQALISQMVDGYNYASDNLITRFDVLINSNEAKNVTVDRKDGKFDTRVLMKYQNSKNTTAYNFYIELQSFLNEVSDGDFIRYHDEVANRDEVFLCLSKPMRVKNYDVNYISNCNQTLNSSEFDEPIPCCADNSSYGVKGVVNTTYYNEYDGKVRYFTQHNDKTAIIRQDMRFIFNQSRDSVYKVVDINRVVTGDVLRIVMDKDTEYSEKDDFENNIADNSHLFKSKDTKIYDNYSIFSESEQMKIRRWTTNTFFIKDMDTDEICKDFEVSIVDMENLKDKITVMKNENGMIEIYNNGKTGTKFEIDFRLGELSYIVEVDLIA